MKEINEIIERLDSALQVLQESAQGRVFDVGTKIIYKGKFGIVTDLNKGSTDPTGSTIDVRLEDGTVVEGVSITSKALEFFRS